MDDDHHRAPPWLAHPRRALAATGALGLALAAAGAALRAAGAPSPWGPWVVTFEPRLDALHAVLALVALAGAATRSRAKAALVARALGLFYLGLSAVGFVSPGLVGLGRLAGVRLDVVENVAHLALGAWSSYAGFGASVAGKKQLA